MSPDQDREAAAYRLARELFALLSAGHPGLARSLETVLARLDPCRHGRDFASVVWHGSAYTFTATQAAAVRVLWQEWQAGTPAVRQETLLAEASSEGARLADLFRDHPAWGALIVPGPARGTFRLAEGPAPPENPPGAP